jgi:hypothetical protein
MFKFFLICILVGYVLYKISSIKVFANGRHRYQATKPEGDTHVKNASSAKPKRSDFKGGEYVDYEEIK